MAELLVRTRSNHHRHPDKDRACYKRGDVVVVMPDGHLWGRMESKKQWAADGAPANTWHGGFVVIEVPGTLVEDYKDLLEPKFSLEEPTKFIRRNKHINLNSLYAQAPRTEQARSKDHGLMKATLENINREKTTKPTVTLSQRALNKLVKL